MVPQQTLLPDYVLSEAHSSICLCACVYAHARMCVCGGWVCLCGFLQEKRGSCSVQVLVSFIEIYKDEVFDLLEPSTLSSEIRIREDEQGNTSKSYGRGKLSLIQAAPSGLGALYWGISLFWVTF